MKEKGLLYKKLDLHIHSPISKCFTDKGITARQIVKKAQEEGLDGIAITDHNSGAFIDEIKKEAKGKIVVFPGVEITCSGGGNIHIIALFDINKSSKTIENLLGALDIREDKQGMDDAIANKTPSEIIDIIHKRGGIAIPAHVNSSHGVLNDMDQQPRLQTMNNKNLLAVEATDFGNISKQKKGKRVIDLLDGKDSNYKRKLAVYQASDNLNERTGEHCLEGIGKRYSYFKMDGINLEGLRLCFCDPDVRIKQMSDYEEKGYPHIISMNVDGGFLHGCNIKFHKGLNSILGGKGVGKSLIIEFLRFGLNQVSKDNDISNDNIGKLVNCLGEFRSVNILFELDNGNLFSINRTFNNEDNPIECTNITEGKEYKGNMDKMFPILSYSQTEVVKIADNPNAQLSLIDNFIDFDEFDENFKNINGKLNTNDSQIAKCIEAIGDMAQLEKDIETTKEQILKINKDLENELFDKYKDIEEEKAWILKELDVNNKDHEKIKHLYQDLKKRYKKEISKPKSKDSGLDLIQKLSNDNIRKVKKVLKKTVEDMGDRNNFMNDKYEEWLEKYDKIKEEYEKMIAESGGEKPKLESNRRKLLKRQKAQEEEFEIMRTNKELYNSLIKERELFLDELDEYYESIYKIRKEKFDDITRKSEDKLELTIHHGKNRVFFSEGLTKCLTGSHIRKTDIEKIVESISPREFVELIIRKDITKITDITGLVVNNVEKIVNTLLGDGIISELIKLQHLAHHEDIPSIKFMKSGGGYYPIENLSVGQKCTALIIIAFIEGSMPVIIDQPEDSLDVTSIYQDIVQKLRLSKEERQYILTTHNSSVAVASDSDKFLILEGTASNTIISSEGAIDRSEVKKEIIDDLEGGKDPYILKNQKYNIKLSE